MTRLLYILIFSTLLFSRSVSGEAEVQYVIEPQFEDAKSFSKGLARVKIGASGDISTRQENMLSSRNLTVSGLLLRV